MSPLLSSLTFSLTEEMTFLNVLPFPSPPPPLPSAPPTPPPPRSGPDLGEEEISGRGHGFTQLLQLHLALVPF